MARTTCTTSTESASQEYQEYKVWHLCVCGMFGVAVAFRAEVEAYVCNLRANFSPNSQARICAKSDNAC